jgi:hypothetical protein
MMGDLLGGNKMWLMQVKGIGGPLNYERVDYWEFNRSEVESLRGVLDDIASEMSERVRKTDLTSGGKPLPRPPSISELRNLSDDELAVLENAARIIERAGADQATSLPG